MTDQQQPDHQERSIEQVRADLIAPLLERDRARRPEIIARGLDPANDEDPFKFVRLLVDEWSDPAVDDARRTGLVKFLADHIDVSDLRALRLISEVVAAVTIQRIRAEASNGIRPANIARAYDVTESYVYRVIREQRAATTDQQ